MNFGSGNTIGWLVCTRGIDGMLLDLGIRLFVYKMLYVCKGLLCDPTSWNFITRREKRRKLKWNPVCIH